MDGFSFGSIEIRFEKNIQIGLTVQVTIDHGNLGGRQSDGFGNVNTIRESQPRLTLP